MSYDFDYPAIWNRVMLSLREEIGATSYEIWFPQVKFNTFRNDKIYISVPNNLNREWIESRYLDNIQQKFRDLTNQNISVVLTTGVEKEGVFTLLNPKYTFDTFVVGNSNRFAHAACYAVGESPSRAYNPLFIYGGVGLGKTHLMQAIAHHILKKNPSYSVTYVSSEQFTNELISSIKDDNTSGFRNKYRNIDVLLIDDIQFLAGKERTQEEFFHTFNTLYESNKQLVISSDRPPRNIPTLEDRLRSRFEWGLITDIQAPDLETRIAILRKKAVTEGWKLPNNVITYIADLINSNIRELEGALIRVIAYASLTNQEITMELANEVLKDVVSTQQTQKITIPLIQQIVADYFQISTDDLKSKRRTQNITLPRQIAMYLCRELTDASLPKIGDEFGGKDHTTVIHACNRVKEFMTSEPKTNQTIRELVQKINQ